MLKSSSLRGERGFTLIETMVSAFLLLVGVLGTLSLIDGANASTRTTKSREAAHNVGRSVIEAMRAVPYPQLEPGTVVQGLQAQPNLSDSVPAVGWQLQQRNVTYTVNVTVCTMDDSSDGTGARDVASTFCSDAPAAGTADVNPDDYKRVSVTLNWRQENRAHQVTHNGVINNPGSAFAPRITNLVAQTPNTVNLSYNPPSAAPAAVTYRATTSFTPTGGVIWSVDGLPGDGLPPGNATGSATTWDFTWPIANRLDGTYVVSAEAFDAKGQSGANRSLTVTLNRFAPLAVKGPDILDAPMGGYNPGVGVEVEWVANQERDITGYRVYKIVGTPGGGDDTLVCSLPRTATTCRHAGGVSGSYYVLATAPGRPGTPNPEEGDRSLPVDVSTTNLAPSAPGNLAATRTGGVTSLTWDSPAGANPAGEPGDSIRYYRIYRDGNQYAARYDRTSGTELTFSDRNAGTVTHTYYVTAVDGHLRESTVVGPVTL